jgi:hypothetical protein
MHPPRRISGWFVVWLLALSCADPAADQDVSSLAEKSIATAPSESLTASPSGPPSYLDPDERWAPSVHREGDLVVMPITFPDGTTAELHYPPELSLEERFSVYPDTFAAGGPQACGSSVHATRHDPSGGWVVGSEPLALFPRPDGSVAELWDGEPLSEPHDYLLFRFDSWTVLVPCRWHGDWDREEVSVWSENVHGQESPDGLLVLTGTSPLKVNPYDDRSGPTVRFSTNDLVLDLTVGPEACRWRLNDRGVGDGNVQWCIQPAGGIWLYATMFTATAEKLLRGLVEDLQVLNVRSPT